MTDEQFQPAIDHLVTCEAAYASIGSAGMFALSLVIVPLRDRVNAGERTQELYGAIMEVAL